MQKNLAPVCASCTKTCHWFFGVLLLLALVFLAWRPTVGRLPNHHNREPTRPLPGACSCAAVCRRSARLKQRCSMPSVQSSPCPSWPCPPSSPWAMAVAVLQRSSWSSLGAVVQPIGMKLENAATEQNKQRWNPPPCRRHKGRVVSFSERCFQF